MNRVRFLALLLGIVAVSALSESAKKVPPPRVREAGDSVARAPVAGEPFDDGELAEYFELEGRRLLKAGKVKPIEASPRRCSLRLASVPTQKRPLTETAPMVEQATVVIGEFYREEKALAFSSAAGGFLVSEDGAIVTSRHVVSEKDSLRFRGHAPGWAGLRGERSHRVRSHR